VYSSFSFWATGSQFSFLEGWRKTGGDSPALPSDPSLILPSDPSLILLTAYADKTKAGIARRHKTKMHVTCATLLNDDTFMLMYVDVCR
jgi:hypothetical protein